MKAHQSKAEAAQDPLSAGNNVVDAEAKDSVQRHSPSKLICKKTEELRVTMTDFLRGTVIIMAATPSVEEGKGSPGCGSQAPAPEHPPHHA